MVVPLFELTRKSVLRKSNPATAERTASGAVESIATILSLYDGLIPPTANLENLDPGVTLDVVSGEARKVKLTAAMNDSFGFGGHNVALVFVAT